jgi:hypothetical protein
MTSKLLMKKNPKAFSNDVPIFVPNQKIQGK